MKKLLKTLGILCLLVAGALGTRRVILNQRFERNILIVQQGMTEQDVVTLLGKADRVYRPCWARHARCSYDSAYGIPYRLVGFWLVSFDESGNVIEKEELDSP